jgi:acyl-CoA dehydrogenase
MIDFSLSDEQRRLLDLARKFSSNEIRPVALQYDRDGTYPEAILKKAH